MNRKRQGRQRPLVVVLAALIVVSLLVVLSALLLMACGSGGGTTSSGSAAAKGPKLLIVASHRAPYENLDPSVESIDSQYHGNVYETLTRYNFNTGKVEPRLATEWTPSDNGKTWTFKIRQGVKFHDGTTLDAAAVKFSIERTRDGGKGYAYLWTDITAIDTPDQYTVVFHAKYPMPLQLMMASSLGAYIMSPTAVKAQPSDWLQSHDAGSGPYKLKSLVEGQEVTLERFADYWKGWSGNHFDAVVLKYVSEATSRRQLVETGQAGIASLLSVEDLAALGTNPNVKIVETPSWVDMGFRINTLKKPTSDVLVRKALLYSIPYDKIIQGALGGSGTRTYGPIIPGLWGYDEQMAMLDANPDLKYNEDLGKAKTLLAQAGYPNGGFTLTAIYYAGNLRSDMVCQLWKENLRKLNINLDYRGMPTAAIGVYMREKKGQSVLVSNWWPAYPSPYDNLYNLLHTQNPPSFNISYYSNPAFDKLIDKGHEISAVDQAKAAQMFAEAIKLELPDAPMATLYAEKNEPAINTKVVGSWEGFNPNYQWEVQGYDVTPAQ